MRLVISRKDWVKAVKATPPTLRQHLMKEVFEAVNRPLADGDIDRDDCGSMFFGVDEADLDAVLAEHNGDVWLSVTFWNRAGIRLSELQLPQEVQDRVLAQVKQLLPPKRTSGRGKKTTKASD